MSNALPREPDMPRAALIALGAIMGLSIVVAAVSRHSHTADAPPSHAVAVRLLGFADQADGSVAVTDQALGTLVAILPKGADSFIRTSIRDLVRTRHGADRPSPFQLTQWDDGRLTLTDTADGRTLELEAFGPTNWGDFARLLTTEETAR